MIKYIQQICTILAFPKQKHSWVSLLSSLWRNVASWAWSSSRCQPSLTLMQTNCICVNDKQGNRQHSKSVSSLSFLHLPSSLQSRVWRSLFESVALQCEFFLHRNRSVASARRSRNCCQERCECGYYHLHRHLNNTVFLHTQILFLKRISFFLETIATPHFDL